MKESTRIISALICVCLIFVTVFAGRNGAAAEVEEVVADTDSLVVWYTDDGITDYLNSMAVEYHEKYDVRVIPKLQSGSDYIETIYAASMDEDTTPDLCIMGSDVLEKAYMSGCAAEISADELINNRDIFPETAVNAVTYREKLVAYPMYFETTALVYNETHLREIATNLVMAENATTPEDENEDNSDEEDTEENNPYAGLSEEEQIELRMSTEVPGTFEELLSFADEFDAPAGVESIFKWDVRDIFYNYFFLGDYINIGGKAGDNPDEIDIYNLDAIKALTLFQDMNQFFSFESSDVTYAKVMDEFIQGKLVFATVTTDALDTLDEAAKNGDFPYEYGVTMIPDISEDMETRSLSATTVLAVNGYSDMQDRANAFAKYLVSDRADVLYEKTGKLPVKKGIIDSDSKAYAFTEEYSCSVPMPKMMSTSNYWLLIEGTFADVWSGVDVSTSLKELSEQIKHQITGETVVEEYIEPPKPEEENVEYLDEDALKQQAKDEASE